IETLLNGAVVSDDEVKAAYVAQNESAKIVYVKFTSFMFRGESKPAGDAEADEYAKGHQKEIEDAYKKDQKTRYTEGQAVRVRAITIPVKPGATSDEEKAAAARIEVAAGEVKAGKD